MPSAKGSPPERALLAAGTASYDCPEFQGLSKVPEALSSVVEVLTELGFGIVLRAPGYRLNPPMKSLREAIRKAANSSPVVVVYYTGHGANPERDTYYLISKNSQPANLSESGLPVRDLLTLLIRRDQNGEPLRDQPTVLVILDSCYSGSAGMIMLGEALRGIGNTNIWIIVSAGALEYAQQGLFAKTFCDALRQPTTGPSQRFVSLDTLVQAVNDAHSGGVQQMARIFPPATGSVGIPPFFPNPYFQPGLAGLTVDEQHWLSRVRAGPEETTTGFYLTGKSGRLLAVKHLTAWMTSGEAKSLAVVTGSPGTGKSALLALPVLLTQEARRQDLLQASEPDSLIPYTAEMLPLATPVVPVHVRGLNTDQTARIIAIALGRKSSTASALLESLDSAPKLNRKVLVVDAVDEAVSPGTLVKGLLEPLAHQPRLQVVVGARRHVLSTVVQSDLTIDLDTSTYQDPEALTDYVYRLLTASEEPAISTPYVPITAAAQKNLHEATATVAAVIAGRAGANQSGPESFLIGRLLALSVRNRGEPVDVAKQDWQAEVPSSVADAFDQDLARLREKQQPARTLLAALAWSNGPGLPWENIWVPVAKALARFADSGDLSVTDEDVRWLLGKAGAYIVEDLGPEERSVYRPFHELLAGHLRGDPNVGKAPTDPSAKQVWERRRIRIQKAIMTALLGTVPTNSDGRRDWEAAHPYLRTYLAQHAAYAGPVSLLGLVRDVDFLAVADPITLNPLLPVTEPGFRDIVKIYRRARPLLGQNCYTNAAYIQEAQRALTGKSVRAKDSSIRPLYRTLLASVRRDDSILTLVGHSGPVNSVALATSPDGQLMLASGGDDATVRLWDPVSGAQNWPTSDRPQRSGELCGPGH